jgi:cell division protein FtsB
MRSNALLEGVTDPITGAKEESKQIFRVQGRQLQIVALMRNKQEKRMSITNCFLQNHVLISVLLVIALRPVAMEAASESDRLERLERAVEQLQTRNAELEAEFRSLKKQTVSVPDGVLSRAVMFVAHQT